MREEGEEGGDSGRSELKKGRVNTVGGRGKKIWERREGERFRESARKREKEEETERRGWRRKCRQEEDVGGKSHDIVRGQKNEVK